MEREIILHLAAAPITFVARLKLPAEGENGCAAVAKTGILARSSRLRSRLSALPVNEPLASIERAARVHPR